MRDMIILQSKTVYKLMIYKENKHCRTSEYSYAAVYVLHVFMFLSEWQV